MAFEHLDNLLENLCQQPHWEQYQQYRSLLAAWQSVVGEKAALHCRPLYISRHILWVATSSSVWAQTLSLQRATLLKKLNTTLTEQLLDLRFSPAQWYQSSSNPATTEAAEHPSDIESEDLASLLSQLPEGNTPLDAFHRWATILKQRSQHLPLCPRCDCPTPEGELKRWGFCAHCAFSD